MKAVNFVATLGMPFQILPDYQEGAEEVRTLSQKLVRATILVQVFTEHKTLT